MDADNLLDEIVDDVPLDGGRWVTRGAVQIWEPLPRLRLLRDVLRERYSEPTWFAQPGPDDSELTCARRRAELQKELHSSNDGEYQDADPVVIQRILGGDGDVPANRAERVAVVALTRVASRSLGQLAARTGWNVNRYYAASESPEAALAALPHEFVSLLIGIVPAIPDTTPDRKAS